MAPPLQPGISEYKVIVAGSRGFTDRALLRRVIYHYGMALGPTIGMSVVSGMARGADRLAYHLCQKEHIQCYLFPANWDQYGKSAGYRRNEAMADFADALIAFQHTTPTPGTAHMINLMIKRQKPVKIIQWGEGAIPVNYQ